MNLGQPGTSKRIELLLSDVDGTLLTSDKVLTRATCSAVQKLYNVGIKFAITSSRPPRGLQSLIMPLALKAPIGAFNGGMCVNPDMSLISKKTIPQTTILTIAAILNDYNLSIWAYSGNDWYVDVAQGEHLKREQRTLGVPPYIVSDPTALPVELVKIVGVSDQYDAVQRCEGEIELQLGAQLSVVRSQPYYLDITDRLANKGSVVEMLARHYSIDQNLIATIGDGANDVLMFQRSGLSIAMGNAHPDVKAKANYVTASNDEEGFALAVENFVLGLSC